jgi:photosystem II stability/assembly factor-like uncharacterized protein
MARSTAGRRRTRRIGAVPTRRPVRRWNPRWLLFGIIAGLIAIAIVVAFGPGGLARARPISIIETSDFHALALSRADPSVVYFGHHNGLLRSMDGGRKWEPIIEQPEVDAMGLAFPPDGSGRILLAGHNGLQTSTDGGQTWTMVSNDLPSQDIYGFAMKPDEPNRLHAFVVARGLFTSADGGETWLRLAGDQPFDILALASAGGNPERLYLSSARTGLFRSVDGGTTWTSVPTGPGSGPVFALAVDHQSRAVYAGTADGLYRSVDGGDTWKKLSYPGKNARSVAVSPTQSGTLLALSMEDRRGLLFRSEDGGATWVR